MQYHSQTCFPSCACRSQTCRDSTSSLISSNNTIINNSWAQRMVLHLATLFLEASKKWFVPGPVPFNIFVNDLEEVVQHCLLKFEDETKPRGTINMPEGRAATQRDLGRVEEWANRNLMKFNKDECKVLHWGRNNPLHMCTGYGLPGWSTGLLKRPCRVLVDNMLNISQVCVLAVKKVNNSLGCINRSTGNGWRKVDECWVKGDNQSHVDTASSLGTSSTRKIEYLERVQWRATRMVGDWSTFSSEERLRELGLLSPRKDNFEGNIAAACPRGHWEHRAGLFPEVQGGRTRDNRLKLTQQMSSPGIRKTILTNRIINP